MFQSIQENDSNANSILNFLNTRVDSQTISQLKILDVCCGAYQSVSVSYDPENEIYKPIVAETLASYGFNVSGVDFRSNIYPVSYKHYSGIDIYDQKRLVELGSDWDVVIFNRSWDTPELILKMQSESGEKDLDILTRLLASRFLPLFRKILKTGSVFITTEIVIENSFLGGRFSNTSSILQSNGFDVIMCTEGLYFTKKM